MSIEALQVTELDKQAESFISDMANEFKEAGLDELQDSVSVAPGDGVAPVEGGEGQVAAETPAPAVETPPEEKAAPDIGYERLVQREVALLEREKQVKSWETEKARYEERIKTLEARAIPDDWTVQLESDPETVLSQLGVDPEQLVRRVIAGRFEAQGKPVPEELSASLRSTKDKLEATRRIQALEARIQAQEREQRAKAFFDQVNTGAREYVTKGISDKLPTVSQVAKRNPDWVHGQIMEVISLDAQQKAARDPNAQLLSYEEAAGLVEKHLATLRGVLIPENANTGEVKAEPKPNTPIVGAKNGNPPQQSPKPGVPVVTTPEKPLAPWLQKPESDDAALREAILEYRRVEKLGPGA